MVSQQLETIHKSIEKDPVLRKRLDSVTDKDAYVDLLVEVGGANGVPMSAAEIDGALSAANTNRGPVGEMSDQQLESVAGGGFFESWYYERFTSGYVKCS